MELERFEELVRRGLDLIPDEIHARMSNVDIEVQDLPSAQQLAAAGVPQGHTLLGLYVGIPLTRRTSGYNMVMPDRIIIFQRPLERISRNEAALVERVRDTVIHEVAHHFGISDERLDEIEAERHKEQ
ncbi:MAG: metallopeptidase family protein [Chloroflexi bacterium]|nr:metallopeptidase family protein [Chloroflexota bacterium]